MKKLATAIAAIALLASCEDGFQFNPKQLQFQGPRNSEQPYAIIATSENHQVTITNGHWADGYNVRPGETVTVECLEGDSVLLFVGGDTHDDGEYYISEGETLKIRVK